MTDTRKQLLEALEALVDSHSLTNVVSVLSEICFEKGDHLRSAWGDQRTGRAWDQDGKKLDAVASKLNF